MQARHSVKAFVQASAIACMWREQYWRECAGGSLNDFGGVRTDSALPW